MRDLTQGAIWRHLVSIGLFIAAGLIVQTLYLLIDLYFVSHLGKEAIAGVATAGTATFITLSISQLVGVGSLSLISHAIGRKDRADAQAIFEQALCLSLVMGATYLVLVYAVGGWAVSRMAADAVTAGFGRSYLFAYLPSLGMMFLGSALGSALRAAGVVGGPMLLQSGTVLINALLAPVLILGWGTHHPLGVLGAGLASSIAAACGAFAMAMLFNRMQSMMHFPGSLRPRLDVWRRIALVGVPAMGDFALLFIVTSVAYWAIRGFGPQAQAAYGIGARVMQAIFLPAMAVAFAAGPIAGQNFGARHAQRVRDTFRHAMVIGAAIMLVLTLLCHVAPALLIAPFTSDPVVIAMGVELLRISSWNFICIGLTFCCSGMFQALGDTRPALLSSASRLLTYALPAVWLAGQPWVSLRDFWYLGVASVTVQAIVSFCLLRVQLHRKLRVFAPV